MYTFTKDKTTVQVEGGAAVDAVKDVTITADGNELDLTGGEAGIRAAAGKTVDITAGTLKVNGKTGIDAAGTVTLKGKSEITGPEGCQRTEGRKRNAWHIDHLWRCRKQRPSDT